MLKEALIAAACAATAIAAQGAHAAGYPDKLITLIIGFSPGGPTDSIGRVLFKQVSQELGVPIVIENRPGAGGTLGEQDLLRAKPDGYTLLYGTSSITTAPALFGRDDLNPKTAFDAAGCSVAVPLILLTAQKLNAQDAASFYKDVKASPGKYFMGSSGNGAIDHLVGMDIAAKLGLDFQHVPYKGNGPALTDLAAGTTSFMYSGSFNSAMPFIKDGRVKALAVTSAKRSNALPDVPTLSESVPGLEGYDAGTWQVLLAPKGTDPDILQKLDQALKAAMKNPDVLKSLRFQGAEVMDKTPQECQAYINTEYDRWSGTINRLGLKAGG
ncbi:tripartite tricarboxylate transporter substrate binding protein [Allopusillimonas soli]|uniref:Tripartite tricarboxylate transporter substrate binding protein n=1 Tax=Allopusillimonas soli TaxID=659016 RepID=A0A853F8Y6_9BURK|nr:tripartite tricarboxylate transporter substrate binding protein [Allopusillimonas soli]NYT35410.1 tripartite tricarboxylate transporter substrate binding protein [Allopusillimonas soli]TEA75825.1 tripartite tricarboxylate transporter substrate binding protein [Allopusillimonas soli]